MSAKVEERINITTLKVIKETIKKLFPQIIDDEYITELILRMSAHKDPLVQSVRYLSSGLRFLSRANLTEQTFFTQFNKSNFLLSQYNIQSFHALVRRFSEVPVAFITETFYENCRLFIPTAVAITANLSRENDKTLWKGTSFEKETTQISKNFTTLDKHLEKDLEILESDLAEEYYGLYLLQQRFHTQYPPLPDEYSPSTKGEPLVKNETTDRVLVNMTIRNDNFPLILNGSILPSNEMEEINRLDTIFSGICPFCYFPLKPLFHTNTSPSPLQDEWICGKNNSSLSCCKKYKYIIHQSSRY